MPMVRGIVTRAISARRGEMTNIITITPTTVSSDVTTWDTVCCMLCPMLSTSFVTRLSSSPRCIRSKVRSGSRCTLCSTCIRSRCMARWTMPLSSRAWSHANMLPRT